MKIFNKNNLVIFLLSVLGVLATDSLAPLIQKVSESFPGVSEPVVRQLVTLPSTISMIVGLISGQLVRYFSKKSIVIFGLVIYFLAGVGGTQVSTFTGHLILRSLLGVGIGLIAPIGLSLITDFFSGNERADMIGNSMAFTKIFAILVPPIAALLAVNNWRNVYFMYLFSLIILVFIIFALDDPKRGVDDQNTEKQKGKIPSKTIFLAFLQFLLMASFFILITDLPYLMEIKKNNSTLLSGFGLSTTTIGTTIAGLIFGKLMAKLKNWIIPLGLMIMGVGFLIVTQSMSSGIILIGLMFAGFGIGVLLMVNNLTVNNLSGEGDSTAAMSLVTCASSLGVFVSPFFYNLIPSTNIYLSPVQSDFQTAGLIYLFIGVISLGFLAFSFFKNSYERKVAP